MIQLRHLVLAAALLLLAAARPAAAQGTEQGTAPVPLDTLRAYAMEAVDELPSLKNRDAVARLLRRLYPPALRYPGFRGSTMVGMVLEDDGVPLEAVVTHSSGYPEVDEAALQVARAMRFRPAKADGRRVRVYVELPVTFVHER